MLRELGNTEAWSGWGVGGARGCVDSAAIGGWSCLTGYMEGKCTQVVVSFPPHAERRVW